MAPHLSNLTEDPLKETYQQYLMEYMPIIVLMSVTGVIGIVGNIFTLLFYGVKTRKTSTIVFIIVLATIDLTVCFISFTTIADMCVNVYFKGEYLCKAMYFFDHWSVVSSVLILWIISIDRYRKICKSFGRQFHMKSALIAAIILIGMALLNAIPAFITYDIVRVNMTTPDGNSYVEGNYCTNTDKAELHTIVTVFHVFDALVILSVFVTFVVTYGQICYTLRKHNERSISMKPATRRSTEITLDEKTAASSTSLAISLSTDSLDGRAGTGPVTSYKQTHLTYPNCDGLRPVSNISIRNASQNDISRGTTKPSHSDKVSNSERNISVMMLAVSVGFIICFLPYFIVTGIRIFTLTGEKEMAPSIQFMLRSPFFNSVINPIIFCFFNPQFRRYIKETILGCKIVTQASGSTSSQ